MTENVRLSPGPRGHETRALILDAGARLVGRFGFRKTTITAIAEAAGIAKATVYLYFKNKEDLYRQLIERESRRVLEEVATSVRKETTVRTKLKAFVVSRYRHINSLVELYNADRRVLLDNLPMMQQFSSKFDEAERLLVAEILALGEETGELEIRSLPIALFAFTGALRQLDLPWIYSPGADIDLEQNADELVDLFLNGLARRDRSGGQN